MTPDTPTDDDTRHMAAAIAASREALRAGDMPFGATLVKDGVQLWVARNHQCSTQDCTSHAETALVREVHAALGPQATQGATVYASGEPCAMCAGAMFWAGIREVVYGASTPDITAQLGGPSLPLRCAEALAGCVPAITVRGPVLGDEAVAVLADWAAIQPAP